MPKIWYTKPPGPYALSSYYYYLDEPPGYQLVRIRLELNRDHIGYDDGRTGAFFTPFTRVGFSSHIFTPDDRMKFSLAENGCITAPLNNVLRSYGIDLDHPKRGELYKEPVLGYHVYDYMVVSDWQNSPLNVPHMGNIVVDPFDAKWPPGITTDDLERLAQLCLRYAVNIKLTSKDAHPNDLAKEIKRLVRPWNI